MSRSKDKHEKLIILGQSGSGKDFLMRKIVKKDLIGCLKTTTRPKRNHEEQGITYDFVTDTSFKEKIDNDEMLCYQTFNVTPTDRNPETWYYGITKAEFERAQVFIMTPGEFTCIDPVTRKKCFVVYLDIDRDIRESRILRRSDKNDSVKRRLDADEEDFKGFGDYDLRVTDPDFTAEDVYDLMD
jgi:guanylate kinase